VRNTDTLGHASKLQRESRASSTAAPGSQEPAEAKRASQKARAEIGAASRSRASRARRGGEEGESAGWLVRSWLCPASIPAASQSPRTASRGEAKDNLAALSRHARRRATIRPLTLSLLPASTNQPCPRPSSTPGRTSAPRAQSPRTACSCSSTARVRLVLVLLLVAPPPPRADTASPSPCSLRHHQVPRRGPSHSLLPFPQLPLTRSPNSTPAATRSSSARQGATRPRRSRTSATRTRRARSSTSTTSARAPRCARSPFRAPRSTSRRRRRRRRRRRARLPGGLRGLVALAPSSAAPRRAPALLHLQPAEPGEVAAAARPRLDTASPLVHPQQPLLSCDRTLTRALCAATGHGQGCRTGKVGARGGGRKGRGVRRLSSSRPSRARTSTALVRSGLMA